MPEASLIIPIYKAASFLTRNLEEIDAFLSQNPKSWELILVVDASPDESGEICNRFAEQSRSYPVRVLINSKNLGKGGSVARGMLTAKGTWRIFTDCDLAYPMSEVQKVLDTLKSGAEVAIASRVHPDSKYTISPKDFHYLYTRHLSSRLFNWVVRKISLKTYNDTQAGLKGFSSTAAKFLFVQLRLERFSFDVELLHLALKAGLDIREVPVHFLYQQEPSTMDFFSDAFRMVRDVAGVYWRSSRGVYQLEKNETQPIQLLIHADDFGLSEGISDGILEAFKAGRLTSTSALVNFKTSAKSLQLARQQGLDLGWHLNLSLGKPLSDPKQIPSLVQSDGSFYPLSKLIKRLYLKQVRPAEIATELKRQFEFFSEHNIKPTHVDGHQHVHVLPSVREALRDLLTEHPIDFVRLPCEPQALRTDRYFGNFYLRHLKGSQPDFWSGLGVRSLPFTGFSFSHEAGELAAWKQLIWKLIAAKIFGPIEVMVHPGRVTQGETLDGDDFAGNRNKELKLLLSEEWKCWMEANHVELIGFKGVQDHSPLTASASKIQSSVEA